MKKRLRLLIYCSLTFITGAAHAHEASPWLLPDECLRNITMDEESTDVVSCTGSEKKSLLCDEGAEIIQKNYNISFGDAISVSLSQADVSGQWQVFPQNGVSVTQGQGSATGEIIFSQPGTFKVVFTVPAHGDHEAHSDIATVEVSGVKMNFQIHEAVLSATLKAGVSAEGTTISIPVDVKIYSGENIEYKSGVSKSTGVNGISASLPGKLSLTSGNNVITFNLSGTPASAGKSQLGFFDLQGKGFFYNFLITE